MIDRWPFGDARHHPAAVVKYWGTPPRARTFLRPVVVPGPHCVADGKPPDCWRDILLPPSFDLFSAGSPEELDLMAQAVVLRNAVIMRGPPSDDCWNLLGYEVRRGDTSGGCLRPDLTPATKVELHQPATATVTVPAPSHPLVIAAVALGRSRRHHEGIDRIHADLVSQAPQASRFDHLAALIVAIIARDLHRGHDQYRAWGGALFALWPLLAVGQEVSPIMPLLDATALMESPIILDGELMDPDAIPVIPSPHTGIPGAATRWLRAVHLGRTPHRTQHQQPRQQP